MDTLASLKNTYEDFTVEFEVVPSVNYAEKQDERQKKISDGIASIDEQLVENKRVLDEFNSEIDKLENHADGIDYMVAVASGILAGIIDIVFVGDFSLEKASELGNKKVNNFVVKIAQRKNYKGEDLSGAVKFLERECPIAADGATNGFGAGTQHHLRDFSHHPTLVGLLFSLLTQFTGKVYGTDNKGFFKIVNLPDKVKEDRIGKNFPDKILFGVVHWFFHMVSDMAGSSGSIQKGKTGTGLPGPLVSLLKEISALPFFKNLNSKGYKDFSEWVYKLFNGKLLSKRDENGDLIPLKFDLRTEIGVMHQLGEQAVPVIINECIVRGFYFIRRLYVEIRNSNVKKVCELKDINWGNTLPFKNRTIIRMLTISTGTMTVIDLADAAIEAAAKSGGVGPLFAADMLVKVNFMGVGRFAIAVGTDAKMGVKRSKLRNERIVAMNEQIFLMNGKTFYKQAEMWIAAESAGETIREAYSLMEKTAEAYVRAYSDMKSDLKKIGVYSTDIEKNNAGLLKEICDVIQWGGNIDEEE